MMKMLQKKKKTLQRVEMENIGKKIPSGHLLN